MTAEDFIESEKNLSPEDVLKKHFEAKGYFFDHFKNWLDFKIHLPTIYSAMGEYAAIHTFQQVMNQSNRMHTLNMSLKKVGLRLTVLQSGEWDLENDVETQTIKP